MNPVPPSEQIVIPVLGMHRSGTSLTTRLLNLLGMELGGPLQPPGPDNPMGFWENRLFQNVNMQMLQQHEFNVDGFGSESALYQAFSRLEQTPIGTQTQRHIQASLQEQFKGSCWGFKDPRTVLNYPMWERLLPELGYPNLRPVVVLRRPYACMQSLRRRGDAGQVPRPVGQPVECFLLDMWRAYTRILLQHLDLDQCLVLAQEDLLDAQTAPKELKRMAAWIGLPEADCSAALEWIQSGLDHREPELPTEQDAELESMDRILRSQARAQRIQFLGAPVPAAPPALEMPPDWSIYVVTPTRYGHSEAFSEIAQTLHHGFARLGIEAPIVRDSWNIRGTPIVLGANLLADFPTSEKLPEESILYNLEQVEPGSDWLNPGYIEVLKRYRVWDYSRQNIAQLEQLGIQGAQLCEIGFVPELIRIPRRPQDIDILFYGSLNPRRRQVLKQLSDRGAKVKILQGLYGPARDAWIARSKIVLNIHFYKAKVLEIVRLSYLLSNARFVISEQGRDVDLEADYTQGLVLDTYEMLVPQCLTWLQNAPARDAIAAAGQRIFSQRDQTTFLRPLIGLDEVNPGD